ncbi:hypothetical protein B0T20DRAFT_395291 [Sordaria brevicollis]|uniref:Uncharacterized protein n=1 Tax=Sordaria brevicollis TaxID=83679 RepID=A0AAE0P986_SORBR|nr:hypothetical protein B0T20DRAFT_395291 [Sordaria brevicollis]
MFKAAKKLSAKATEAFRHPKEGLRALGASILGAADPTGGAYAALPTTPTPSPARARPSASTNKRSAKDQKKKKTTRAIKAKVRFAWPKNLRRRRRPAAEDAVGLLADSEENLGPHTTDRPQADDDAAAAASAAAPPTWGDRAWARLRREGRPSATNTTVAAASTTATTNQPVRCFAVLPWAVAGRQKIGWEWVRREGGGRGGRGGVFGDGGWGWGLGEGSGCGRRMGERGLGFGLWAGPSAAGGDHQIFRGRNEPWGLRA